MAGFQIAGELVLTTAKINKNVFTEINKGLNQIPVKRLEVLAQTTDKAVKSTDKLAVSQDKAGRSAKNAAVGIRQTSNAIEDFGDKAGLALRRFAAFTIAATGVFGTLRVIRQGVGDAIKFNRELVKVAQVTGRTAESLSGLRDEIGNLSVEFGTSSQSLVGVARTLSQAGLSARETQKALQALAQTTLAPTFTDISKTTEGAIASLRQFNLQAEDLSQTFGIINAVAGKFAVESDDIITGIRKAGAAFSAANQGIKSGNDSLAEFVALFTSVRATTRESADTIGTGLRTIFTRIQRPETIQFLRQFGVELTDLQGKFIGPFQAIQRLGVALRELNPRDTRFATIVEEIGGFRQVSRVIPLLQQTGLQFDALKVALEGQDSVAKDAAIAQQDLGVQIEQTRESFSKLLRDITNTDSFQTLIKGSIDLANALISLADSAKEVIPLLGALAAVRGLTGVARALPSFGSRVVTGRPRLRRQDGGFVPGIGEGDKIGALLEPGEFVLNKMAVAAVGKRDLEKLNKGIPRFQTGGFVGFQTGGSVTGRFARFSGNEEFREGIDLAIGALKEFGFNADQISEILNRATDKAKGPGEALGGIFKELEKNAAAFDKSLIQRTKESNRGSRISQAGSAVKPLGANDPLATTSFFAGPESDFSDFRRGQPPILQNFVGDTEERPQNIGALGRTRVRPSGAPRGGSGRVSTRRSSSRVVRDSRPLALSDVSQLDAVLDDNFFRRLDQGRSGFFNQLPGDVVGLTRDDFNDTTGIPPRAATSIGADEASRRARIGSRARNIGRIRRNRRVRNFATGTARIGGAGLALGAGFVDPESSLGQGVQAGGIGAASASLIGLGPVGAAAIGIGAGVNTFLGARQQQRETESLDALTKASDELVNAFKELGVSTKDLAEIQNRSAEFNERISNFTQDQLARDSSSLGGFVTTGGPFGASDTGTNRRIRSARGNASFFGTRILSGALDLANFVSFGGTGELGGNRIQTGIQLEDIRSQRRLEVREAQERADLAAPAAASARQQIEQQLRSGRSVDSLSRDLLQLSQADSADAQGGTALNRQFLGEIFANDLKKKLDDEAVARDKIINALRGFTEEIEDVNRRIEQASGILSFNSARSQISSANSRGLATGGALNFQSPSFFANASAFSREQLLGRATQLGGLVGGGGLNRDIVNRAVSLPGLERELQDLQLRGATGEDDRGRTDELKLEIETAKKASEALQQLENSVNETISIMQQELAVRRDLVRQSDELGVNAIGAAGSFAERRFGLVGRENRFTQRGDFLRAQIQGLTGGAISPNDILAQIQQVRQDRAANAQNPNLSPAQLANNDSRLLESEARLTRALDILSSNVSDLADVQNKLSEIQRKREVGGNLIEDTFGLDFEGARERTRQLSAFALFQQNNGDLGAVARAGFTNQDVSAGFRVRQQFSLDEDQAERERVLFRQNILAGQGINNFEQLANRFGAGNAQNLRPALNLRGNTQQEKDLLAEADAIGERQVQAILAQKQLVDQSIADFNQNIIQGLGRNAAALKEAAQALNTEITVEFKPIDVNINLGQEFQTFRQDLQNGILEQVRSEINTAIGNLQQGQ